MGILPLHLDVFGSQNYMNSVLAYRMGGVNTKLKSDDKMKEPLDNWKDEIKKKENDKEQNKKSVPKQEGFHEFKRRRKKWK